MELQKHANKLETNVENETQNFGIGDASVVIEILRNRLYENKRQTLVQEYICNARDAMREVGKGNDFEITVPTALNPVFKVKDFGPGISPDRMANVFIQYGASTKRSSNLQTGGFGIGAKSAWSYTDSFTITTVVDGIKRSYVAHTGVNNNGRLDLVTTETTDEPNGTEIQIAVRKEDIEYFRKSIFRAIYFWEQKPKLRGELMPPTLVSGTRIGDLEIIDYKLLPEYIPISMYNNEALLVIDGVPYTLNSRLGGQIPNWSELCNLVGKKMIFHVGNGVVGVSASREKIEDSKGTLAALEKIIAKALLEVQTHIADQFGKVKSTTEYLKTYHDMHETFNVDKFAKFDGYTIEGGWITNPLLKKCKITSITCLNKRGGKSNKITKEDLSESRRRIQINKLNNIFIVTTQESPVVQNKRIREFFKSETEMLVIEVGTTFTPVMDAKNNPVLDAEGKQTYTSKVEKAAYAKMVKDLSPKDFSSLTYVDPPKVPRVKVTRENESICLHVFDGRGCTRYTHTTLAKNLADGQKWLYVPIENGHWDSEHNKNQLADLNDYLVETKNLRICGVAGKALKRVMADVAFTPLKNWIKAFKPSKEDVKAVKTKVAKNQTLVDTLRTLQGIKDTDLNEMTEEYKQMRAGKAIALVPDVLALKIENSDEIADFMVRDKKFAKLVKDQYPLVEEIASWSRNKDEIVFYINAKYKSLQKGN